MGIFKEMYVSRWMPRSSKPMSDRNGIVGFDSQTFPPFKSRSCALDRSEDTQRTRLRHLRMVGSEWLTRVPILLQTVTIILLFISKKFSNLYCKLIKEFYEF